jgi:hypothetical protein
MRPAPILLIALSCGAFCGIAQSPPPADWIKHVIASGLQTQTVVPADFDGDGHVDVITGDITPNAERLILYRAPDWKSVVLHEGIHDLRCRIGCE